MDLLCILNGTHAKVLEADRHLRVLMSEQLAAVKLQQGGYSQEAALQATGHLEEAMHWLKDAGHNELPLLSGNPERRCAMAVELARSRFIAGENRAAAVVLRDTVRHSIADWSFSLCGSLSKGSLCPERENDGKTDKADRDFQEKTKKAEGENRDCVTCSFLAPLVYALRHQL